MTKELILLSLYFVLLACIFAARRTRLIPYAAMALGLGLAWTILVSSEYSYNTATINLMSINLYALLGWSLGLLVGYILYASVQRIVRWTGLWRKLLLFNLIYLPLLIAVETIAYHSFNVVNIATASYSGLPLCDCLHAPPWMQMAYLAMGSIYFMLTRLITGRGSSVRLASTQAAAP